MNKKPDLIFYMCVFSKYVVTILVFSQECGLFFIYFNAVSKYSGFPSLDLQLDIFGTFHLYLCIVYLDIFSNAGFWNEMQSLLISTGLRLVKKKETIACFR